MKLIPNKVVQEKDGDGNDIDVNYPAQPLPTDGRRVILDGENGVWKIAYDDADEQKLLDDHPSFKEIIDEQKILASQVINPKP